MRIPAFCICENKDADQLHGNREADQRLCFRYRDSTTPPLPKPQAIFCGCAAQFVSDLIGNPEDRFSHNEAHMKTMMVCICTVQSDCCLYGTEIYYCISRQCRLLAFYPLDEH